MIISREIGVYIIRTSGTMEKRGFHFYGIWECLTYCLLLFKLLYVSIAFLKLIPFRWPAMCIHGDKSQPEREWVLKGSIFCFSYLRFNCFYENYLLKMSASQLNLVLLYGCLKFYRLSENFRFDFQGLKDNLVLLELFPESRPRIISKTFRTKS